MRYLVIILTLICTSAGAQSYKQRYAEYLTTYKQHFVTEKDGPLKAEDLKYLRFYKPDPSYMVQAKIELLSNEKVLNIPTSGGKAKQFTRYAKATFNLKGKALQLTLFRMEGLKNNPAYQDLLFLPFTDETNSQATYGGGRYIDVYTTAISDGLLEIDFNKAYNPYCAYTHGYQCPVPPEENDLAIPVKAGEKLFRKPKL